jgi:hypothetical protein
MAVKSVREHGKSILREAQESGIPYSILQKRLIQGIISATKMRRKPVFSEEKE